MARNSHKKTNPDKLKYFAAFYPTLFHQDKNLQFYHFHGF